MKQYQQASVGALIQNKDGKFLIVKRSEKDDFLPGLWELPGGGLDFGEELQDGLKREIKEETGLIVETIKPVAVNTYPMEKEDEKIQRIEITFLCRITGTDTVLLSDEHTEYKWITKSEVNSINFTPYMLGVITDSIKNI